MRRSGAGRAAISGRSIYANDRESNALIPREAAVLFIQRASKVVHTICNLRTKILRSESHGLDLRTYRYKICKDFTLPNHIFLVVYSEHLFSLKGKPSARNYIKSIFFMFRVLL